jgi:hypothetical protein
VMCLILSPGSEMYWSVAQVVGVDSYHRPRRDAPARPPQGERATQETTDKRAATRHNHTHSSFGSTTQQHTKRFVGWEKCWAK